MLLRELCPGIRSAELHDSSHDRSHDVTHPFDADSWMWDEAVAALELAERRQRRFFALLGTQAVQPVWEPPADVFETDDEVWIVVAMPGVPAEQVTLRVEDTALAVRTERAPTPSLESARIRRLEIPYGVFERRIELPPGRYTLRERRMVDGCLELHLTKE
jgi:HSP20 family molecular chaperone IbpA